MISTDKIINDEQAQMAEAHRQQQQEFLLLYRQSLARLQKEDPMAAASMPGINAVDLEEREKEIVEEMGRIVYSKRYSDMTHQYRHVILPKGIAKWLPSGRLMKESEWRTLGVVQSPGWTHYMIHDPEPHILLFKRPLDA